MFLLSVLGTDRFLLAISFSNVHVSLSFGSIIVSSTVAAFPFHLTVKVVMSLSEAESHP